MRFSYNTYYTKYGCKNTIKTIRIFDKKCFEKEEINEMMEEMVKKSKGSNKEDRN